MKPILNLLVLAALFAVVGCNPPETADTSSPDTSNTPARTEKATQNIQSSSTMSAEQKAAAAAYMQQGAKGAQQMQQQAQAAGSGTPR